MKKISNIESIPEITESLQKVPKDSKIFIAKSMAISKRIFDFLTANGWQQKQLAEGMGKAQAEISKLLSGTHNYTLRTISKVEAVLGIDVILTPGEKVPAFNVELDAIPSYSIKKDLPPEIESQDWRNSEKGNTNEIEEKSENLDIAA